MFLANNENMAVTNVLSLLFSLVLAPLPLLVLLECFDFQLLQRFFISLNYIIKRINHL